MVFGLVSLGVATVIALFCVGAGLATQLYPTYGLFAGGIFVFVSEVCIGLYMIGPRSYGDKEATSGGRLHLVVLAVMAILFQLFATIAIIGQDIVGNASTLDLTVHAAALVLLVATSICAIMFRAWA